MATTSSTSSKNSQILVSLQAVLSSAAFADANRLKSFLKYIVDETLEGRGAAIRAKTIASDVYGRRPEDGVEQESIVRVDAGRLRRRLDVYYAEEGAADEIRIHVLSGGYTPTFEHVEPVVRPEKFLRVDVASGRWGKLGIATVSLVVFGMAGFWIGWMSKANPIASSSMATMSAPQIEKGNEGLVRSSVDRVSSASLLAQTFVEDAHQLIFPAIDLARLKAAEILCQRAIEIAPNASVGHSCDAFAQAYFAFVVPNQELRQTRLLEAQNEAEIALRADPTDPFSQMAYAWTEFVAGERKQAIAHARAALAIAPDESFLRNFFGMMMVFDGQARELVNETISVSDGLVAADIYHPFVMAGAYFQVGQYPQVIELLNKAVESKGQTSALLTSFKIAALEEIGETKSAEIHAKNLMKSWPSNNPQKGLSALFSNKADAKAIIERVDAVIGRLP